MIKFYHTFVSYHIYCTIFLPSLSWTNRLNRRYSLIVSPGFLRRNAVSEVHLILAAFPEGAFDLPDLTSTRRHLHPGEQPNVRLLLEHPLADGGVSILHAFNRPLSLLHLVRPDARNSIGIFLPIDWCDEAPVERQSARVLVRVCVKSRRVCTMNLQAR